MSETAVICLAFGILFVLNVISLILVHTTEYGKDYYKGVKNQGKGYEIFFNIYMLIVGICFWGAVGASKLLEKIRG